MSTPEARPAPPNGHWSDLQDSDLKAGIDKYFRENSGNGEPNYIALIVDVTNPISGYRIQRIPTSKIHN